jgi:hypothetical protein
MELLAEVIASIFQILVELGLQIAADAFAELGFHALKEMIKPSRPAKPGLAAVGYFLTGILAGWISLMLFPVRLAVSPGLRVLILAILPVASALCLWLFLTAINRPPASEDRRRRFWFAYAFGVASALKRFSFGQ